MNIDGRPAGTLETGRLLLIPLDRDQMRAARYDLRAPARIMGIDMPPYRLWEGFFKRRIYRAKCELLKSFPEDGPLITMWLLVEKETGRAVGEAGFKGPPNGGEVEIGYSTRDFAKNRGYMTEAVRALCSFAFNWNRHKISRVCALTKAGNQASHRVLQKSGFNRGGVRGRYWYWLKEASGNPPAKTEK